MPCVNGARPYLANEVILRLDIAQEDRLLSADELAFRQDLKIRILGLAALERSRRQASRITYIRSGDACTRFFHLRMSARKRRQFIPSSLKKQDGTMAWSHDDKQQVLQDYFKNLIGKKEHRLHSLN